MNTLHDFFVYTKGIEYLIAVSFLILFPAFWVLLNRRRVPETVAVQAPDRIAPDRIPAGVFLGPGHAWLQLEGSGAVRIGAGGLPVELLGGLDRAELKSPGTEVKRGEPIAVLRRGERTLTLPSPVSGTIAHVNPEVEADPQQLARDPFAGGWLFKVLPRGLDGAVKKMFVAEEAVAWMRLELQRFRDAVTGLTPTLSPMPASLPDGGLPVAGLAASIPDEAWDELSAQFFTLAPER
ncbi:MAG: glycine cleavage system protein H [bacterium]|nr:glycine cleavage system protein H [bacterium]